MKAINKLYGGGTAHQGQVPRLGDQWATGVHLVLGLSSHQACEDLRLLHKHQTKRASTKMDSINLCTVTKENGFGKSRGPVAGIFLEKAKKKITIYEAFKKRLLKPGTALALLEAQAATVGIVDLVNNRMLAVADAVKDGVVGPEMKEKLLIASKAITGHPRNP
ncbi:hypothetical protein OJAV_G00110290 [Oryzias javanicus]|uniref:Uncharacterized protein n=1 Tax=Oryzias javanicus TaxID=123683 RepID=A0A3S2PQ08_ORYJA|nr:hypothetical protein OJAV_G00110290 [Oryzias javanicus]